MTSDNLTFSLEIDFIPDVEEGRQEFVQKMKDTAKEFNATYSLSVKDKSPTISGLTRDDVNKILPALGLAAFGTWPACILTCNIIAPVPIHAIGMSDGWDIYLGKKTFFAFAQFPADAIQIMVKAATFYLDHEAFQTLEEFVKDMGFDKFRDTVLGNTVPGAENTAGNNDEYYGSSWGMPDVPPLKEGDFVRPENNIMQVLEVYPDMGPLLMEYGMSCVGCFVSYDENIWQASQAHGLDVFEIIGEMNEYIADKYNKKVISESTTMEEILTMYPQLLSVLQSYKITMPADAKTTLGTVCKEAGADLNTVIEKCDERLRGAAEM